MVSYARAPIPSAPIQLKRPKEKVIEWRQSQIDKGNGILSAILETKKELAMTTGYQFELLLTKRSQWSAENMELLSNLFDSIFVEGYKNLPESRPSRLPPVSEYDAFSENMRYQLSYLVDLQKQVKSISEHQTSALPPPEKSHGIENRVFIVHGHDVAAKEAVARFIEKLGLEPVILQERPSGGNTIIEKLEKYSDVGFAVVLLTPDDRGALNDGASPPKPRARQNVIFELGYFMGKLGRNRVSALYKSGIELPSDYERVVYIELDSAKGWQLTLANELRSAGFKIDLNRLSA